MTTKYILNIIPNNDDIASYYKNHSYYNEGDSGIDIFCAEDIVIRAGETKQIKFNISCEMLYLTSDRVWKNTSYTLIPRSSTGKNTPLRLSNSIGLIDAYYRDNISAYCDNIKNYDFTVKKGSRLFQLVAPALTPIVNVKVTNSFKYPYLNRNGGHGSTNKYN